MTEIEEVLVVGAGVMGREIALQCAMHGFRVTVQDTSEPAIRKARAALGVLAATVAGRYVSESPATILGRIYLTTDLAEAAASADIVCESIPEDPQLKADLFARLNELAPAHTIFTTNSSTLLPSGLAAATGRPGYFLALHFHKTVWISNIADVMAHPGTRAEIVDQVESFARKIKQIPVVLRKENQGYVFNAMLGGYLGAALSLWANDVASFEDIDRAWMIAERSDHGPFGTMDFIGLDTIYDTMRWSAVANADPRAAAAVEKLRAEYIDRGRLGEKSGVGFYHYPEPLYRRPDFLGDATELGLSR